MDRKEEFDKTGRKSKKKETGSEELTVVTILLEGKHEEIAVKVLNPLEFLC